MPTAVYFLKIMRGNTPPQRPQRSQPANPPTPATPPASPALNRGYVPPSNPFTKPTPGVTAWKPQINPSPSNLTLPSQAPVLDAINKQGPSIINTTPPSDGEAWRRAITQGPFPEFLPNQSKAFSFGEQHPYVEYPAPPSAPAIQPTNPLSQGSLGKNGDYSKYPPADWTK